MCDAAKFQVKNLVKSKLPRLPLRRIKEAVLGRNYELSLVFSGNSLIRKLNRIYRGKDRPANVLSFALDQRAGEIFINLSKLNRAFPVRSRISNGASLFIHALLHLKGWRHSSKMESEERKFLTLISNRVATNFSRSGYRYQSNQSHYRRNGN